MTLTDRSGSDDTADDREGRDDPVVRPVDEVGEVVAACGGNAASTSWRTAMPMLGGCCVGSLGASATGRDGLRLSHRSLREP